MLQQLVDDGLLKYNYFLLDSRGRNVKSYLKIPPTLIDDPAHESMREKLIKNGIEVKEYFSVFEKSRIPPNNKLSVLSINIFKHNASFVPEYAKYKDELQVVIQEHIQNGHIEEDLNDNFGVKDVNIFSHLYDEIENLTPRDQQKQLRKALNPINPIQRMDNNLAGMNRTTVPILDNPRSVTEKDWEMPRHSIDNTMIDENNVDFIESMHLLRY